MNGTANITWPTTEGTNGIHLSGYILADVKLLLNPRESAAGNMQKQAALQHTCKQPSWHAQPNSTMTMEEDINVEETTLNHVK